MIIVLDTVTRGQNLWRELSEFPWKARNVPPLNALITEKLVHIRKGLWLGI